jgi:Mitochondrial ribosomal protein (VAR1)
MLNMLLSKKKNLNIKKVNKNLTIYPKKFGLLIRNWKNSIYAYNKNTLSLLPEASKLTNKLIKNYLNSFKPKLEKKFLEVFDNNNVDYLNNKKFSTSKVFISNGQFKHTHDLVSITIFFYNRQLLNYKKIIFNIYKELFINYLFKKNIFLIRKTSLRFLIKQINKEKYIVNTLKINNKSQIQDIESYQIKYYKSFINKSLVKYRLILYLKQLVILNKLKFNNFLLQNLTNLVKKIYRKNIQINFINIKYFYLNSDIVTESLVLKIKNNRKTLLRNLNSIIRKANIRDTNFYSKHINKESLFINNKLDYNRLLDNKTKETIFNNLDYKRISGIRLQASGRLTRRNTASRSISKIKYNGNLVNISSSMKGYPSTLLRGSIRPNIELTKLNSITQIGSFGIKGWISGY